jgi:acylphosphatase
VRAVRLHISGRVQSVGYRAWAMQTAARLGVRGWVRNRADGSVEALASGEAAKIDRFVEACRQGPRLAFVSSLNVEAAEPQAGLAGFSQLPTL